MAKNIQQEKKDVINRTNYTIIAIMFVCLIAQIIALYFNLHNIFRVFGYLFGLFTGVGLGFILGAKVLL